MNIKYRTGGRRVATMHMHVRLLCVSSEIRDIIDIAQGATPALNINDDGERPFFQVEVGAQAGSYVSLIIKLRRKVLRLWT